MASSRSRRWSFIGVFGNLSAGVLLAGTHAWAGINSWSSTGPDGGWVYGVSWHPTREGVMFAAAGRIYRSTDQGAHWSPVSPTVSVTGAFIVDPANPDRILASGARAMRSTDGGASFVYAGSPPGGFQMDQLAINSAGSVVYGASAGGRVFRSSDFGLSWEAASTGLNGPSNGGSGGLAASPSDPNTLYVSFSSAGLFKTINGGNSWSPVSSLVGNIGRVTINPNNASQLLVYGFDNTGPHLWRSDDAGASWSVVLSAYLTWVGFDPQVVNRVYATDHPNHRLLVSTDAGGVWLPAANIPSVQASAVGFSPTPNVLALGTTEGVYYSTNAGQTLAFRSSGIRSVDPRAIAVSRSAPFQVYASFYAGPNGVHRRVPDSWLATNTAQLMSAFPAPTVIDGLAVDPNNSSVVYAAGYGGVAKSTNAGDTWVLTSPGFAMSQLNAIAIDPADTQVLYLAATGEGIQRSENGGASWVARNSGLPTVPIFGTSMRHVAIDPANSQRLYAIDPTGVLFRTIDGGLNWAQAGALAPFEPVSTVAFDPFDGNRIYVGTIVALYRSLDSGVTWNAIPLPVGTSDIQSVLPDPEIPGTITLVVGSPAGVIRSVDNGASWERLPWESPGDGIPVYKGVLSPGQHGNLIVGAQRHGMREFQIAPDLSISLTGVEDRIPIGGTPSMRVTVQNKGTSLFATADATVSLQLPAVLAPGAISTSRGTCTRTGQSATCRLGAMKVGESAQIDIPLTASSGTGTVSASVQIHEVDFLVSDNSLTVPVMVQPFADLRATVVAPATVSRSDSAVVAVQVTNLGPHASADTELTIGLPAGLGTLSSFSNPLCSIGSSTTVLCDVGPLAMGGAATIEVPVTGVSIGMHEIVVTATSSTHDPVAENNIVNRSISVRPVTDLAVTLGNVPASFVAGQSVSITATVANNGPDALDMVVATLSGAGLSVIAASPNGGSCSITGGVANCSLGALAAGASRTIDVSFNATAAGAGQVSVAIDSEGSDSATGNNSAVRSVTVIAASSAGGGGGGTGSSGGGGALGLWGLLAMLSWAAARTWTSVSGSR